MMIIFKKKEGASISVNVFNDTAIMCILTCIKELHDGEKKSLSK